MANNNIVAEALKKLLEVLGNTYPGVHNKAEWEVIRKMCSSLQTYMDQGDYEKVFEGIRSVLYGTHPGRSNKAEWAEIRKKCEELFFSSDPLKTKLYLLVLCLSDITPGVDNKAEWDKIREVCANILEDFKP